MTWESDAGHSAIVRADPAARAEPRDDQPPVRALHQGRRHGPLGHQQVQEEVRHHAALQTHGTEAGRHQAALRMSNALIHIILALSHIIEV